MEIQGQDLQMTQQCKVGVSVVHSVGELGRVLFTQQENLGVSCSFSGRVGESAVHAAGELGESTVHSAGELGSELFT